MSSINKYVVDSNIFQTNDEKKQIIRRNINLLKKRKQKEKAQRTKKRKRNNQSGSVSSLSLSSHVSSDSSLSSGGRKRYMKIRKTRRRKTIKMGGEEDGFNDHIKTQEKRKPGVENFSKSLNDSVWKSTSSLEESKRVSGNTKRNTSTFTKKQLMKILKELSLSPNKDEKTKTITFGEDEDNHTMLIPTRGETAELPKFINDIKAAHDQRNKYIKKIVGLDREKKEIIDGERGDKGRIYRDGINQAEEKRKKYQNRLNQNRLNNYIYEDINDKYWDEKNLKIQEEYIEYLNKKLEEKETQINNEKESIEKIEEKWQDKYDKLTEVEKRDIDDFVHSVKPPIDDWWVKREKRGGKTMKRRMKK